MMIQKNGKLIKVYIRTSRDNSHKIWILNNCLIIKKINFNKNLKFYNWNNFLSLNKIKYLYTYYLNDYYLIKKNGSSEKSINKIDIHKLLRDENFKNKFNKIIK